MIADTLPNLRRYASLHPLFPTVLDFLARTDLAALPLGKHPLSDGIMVLADGYDTLRPAETFIECHRRFIDIQIMVQGEERVGICPLTACRAGKYDAERDFQVLEGDCDYLTLRQGSFMIFLPQDGHMPQLICGDSPKPVRKVVVKVPV